MSGHPTVTYFFPRLISQECVGVFLYSENSAATVTREA